MVDMYELLFHQLGNPVSMILQRDWIGRFQIFDRMLWSVDRPNWADIRETPRFDNLRLANVDSTMV